MAFLDNSGDIILDAVLTDTGRMRLAKGDGSFRIVKFAFGDDEVDYSTYNKNHASGSAYYDIERIKLGIGDDRIWGRKFKIRLTSKNSGKKIDFNLNFATKHIKPGDR